MGTLQIKRGLTFFLLGLASLVLLGCRALPGVPQAAGGPVTLGIAIDPSAPEEVRVTWEPGDVTIQEAEVSVTEGGGAQRTITVVLQLGDRP